MLISWIPCTDTHHTTVERLALWVLSLPSAGAVHNICNLLLAVVHRTAAGHQPMAMARKDRRTSCSAVASLRSEHCVLRYFQHLAPGPGSAWQSIVMIAFKLLCSCHNVRLLLA
jgi:hypothetical protein